ncbi:uncharacterized protein F4822DRAFT_441250 [Hypoxylon trugodes]|uniref:uncharacterized protein n=1 Tax=Hypoxylon trugodes TaxID=326681 RepID=UPI00219A9BCB|nr:uncharacterized protein F4822DRAFT_441250 [Hypoxylon trugodes]KAI1392184.1 hypothetical protein F4822DRAFT_441250 [Hypoxylon trugodes]
MDRHNLQQSGRRGTHWPNSRLPGRVAEDTAASGSSGGAPLHSSGLPSSMGFSSHQIAGNMGDTSNRGWAPGRAAPGPLEPVPVGVNQTAINLIGHSHPQVRLAPRIEQTPTIAAAKALFQEAEQNYLRVLENEARRDTHHSMYPTPGLQGPMANPMAPIAGMNFAMPQLSGTFGGQFQAPHTQESYQHIGTTNLNPGVQPFQPPNRSAGLVVSNHSPTRFAPGTPQARRPSTSAMSPEQERFLHQVIQNVNEGRPANGHSNIPRAPSGLGHEASASMGMEQGSHAQVPQNDPHGLINLSSHPDSKGPSPVITLTPPKEDKGETHVLLVPGGGVSLHPHGAHQRRQSNQSSSSSQLSIVAPTARRLSPATCISRNSNPGSAHSSLIEPRSTKSSPEQIGENLWLLDYLHKMAAKSDPELIKSIVKYQQPIDDENDMALQVAGAYGPLEFTPPTEEIQSQRSQWLNDLAGVDGHPSVQKIIHPDMIPFTEAFRDSKMGAAGVICINNIPYDISRAEVIAFLGRSSRIRNDKEEPVHIIMDRTTSKTNDCYIEFMDFQDAINAVHKHRNAMESGRQPRLGGRPVDVTLASQGMLMKQLFPFTKGVDWVAVPYQVGPNTSTWPWDHFKGFVTEEEMTMIFKHAESPGHSPFVLHCPERPFESMISTLKKMPWHMADYITIRERHWIFNAAFKMIELLKETISMIEHPEC